MSGGSRPHKCYSIRVSLNDRNRITFIDPPPEVASVLADAALGLSIIGRANRSGFYLEASRDEQSQLAIIEQISNRIATT